MASELDTILDDLFHGCALAAFVEQAVADAGWPGPNATRDRAYRYYEQALADRGREGPSLNSKDRIHASEAA